MTRARVTYKGAFHHAMNRGYDGKTIFFIFIFFIFIQFSYSQVNKRNIVQKWKTNKTKLTIPLNELIVLLKRDIIKPIDKPVFIDKNEAAKIFYEKEPLIAIEINNIAKAYPLGILAFHEIVNDEINGVKFSVNYCPLCNTCNVYSREVNFKGVKYILDFGTSGMLRKSNLVMWDRQTESWWQQITREAIVGEFSGVKLKQLPSMLISVRQFFTAYPNGKILFPLPMKKKMKYGFNPYYKYDDINVKKPRLFFDKVDPRLPALERVLGIDIKSQTKAYPYSKLRKERIIYDKINKQNIVIFYINGQVSAVDEKWIKDSKEVGTATVFLRKLHGKIINFKANGGYFIDKSTNSKWDITGYCFDGKLKGERLISIAYSVEFSFAWFAFYPNSSIY